MRREILALLILTAFASAALDQSYAMSISRDGSSVISKSFNLALSSDGLDGDALGKISDICQSDSAVGCSVEGTRLTISEGFSPGEYYSFDAEYGLPSITYTVTLKKIPDDKFSLALDGLMRKAGALSGSQGTASPIDLGEEQKNRENAMFLRKFNANMTYMVLMPTNIGYAMAGNTSGMVSGESASFDLLSLMEESRPVVIKSSELNMGYLIILAAFVVLGALAVSFFKSKPARKKK